MRILFTFLLVSCFSLSFGQTWQMLGPSEGQMPSSGSSAEHLSITTDADGAVYLVYRDGSTENKATVKKFNPANKSWEVVGNAGISAGAVTYTAIATDSQKIPYIIYTDESLGRKAIVKRFDAATSAWTTIGAEGISAGEAAFTRIVASNNGIFAGFVDGGQGNQAVIKQYDAASNSWQNVGSAAISAGTAEHLSMVADGDMIYAAYQDGANGQKATVKRYSITAASWTTLGNAGFSLGTAEYIQLGIAGQNIYIAYSDGANGNKATVQQFNAATGQWEVSGTVGFTPSPVSHLALTLDKNSDPYILFRDAGTGNQATAYTYRAAERRWELTGVRGFSSGPVEYTALAKSADGTIYLGYNDGSLNGQAVIRKLNADVARWESFGTGNSVTSAATHIAMTISSDGVPYLVYSEGENSGKAIVKKFNTSGSAWETVGPENISKGLAAYTSIAIGADKLPLIVYQDGANFNRITVQKFDQSGVWKVLGTEGFSAGMATYTSIALDQAGKIWVAYRDASNGNRAVAQKYNAATSTWEAAVNVSTSAAAYTALIADKNGVPYIVYQDGSKGNRISVKRLNTGTSSWEVVGIEGFSAGTASYTTLAFDRTNLPHVIYMDGSASNRATVQRYNAATLKWEVVGTTGFSSGTAAFAGLEFDGNNIPFAVYQDGSKGSRATVASFNQANSLWEVNGEGISAGGVNYTSIVAYQNKLYVAYQDGGLRGNGVVKSINRSAGNWISMGISSADASSPLYNSMTADKDNDIYLFYGNVNSSTVKKLNRATASWSVLGAANAVQGAAHYGAIAVAADKSPYIAFADGSAADKITVKRFSGTAWDIVGTAGFSAGKANFTNIVTDGQNVPYVVFQDEGDAGKGHVKKFDAASSTWKSLGTSGFSAQGATHTSVAIDAAQVIYVAYSDAAKSGRISVKKYNAATNSWLAVGAEGFSAGKASYISLTADKSNILYAAYQDAARADRAVVRKFNAATGAWETVGADGISSGAALFTKLATDNTGKLYLMYRDSWNSDKATVKTFDDVKGAWVTVIKDGFSDGAVTYPALTSIPAGDLYAAYANGVFAGGIQVVKLNKNTPLWENSAPATVSAGRSASYVSAATDRNNIAYIAYRDNSNDNSTIVKKYDATAKVWATVGNENLSEGSTSFTSLAVSPNDTPWVAYQDSTAANKIAVRYFNPANSKWELGAESRVSDGPGTLPSIAIGADNIPYVAYADSNKNYQLTVKRLDRTLAKWVATGPAGFSAAAVNSTSIAVSPDGVPYVVYMDAANGNRATVKRYAFGTDSWETVGEDKITAGSASSPSLVFDRNNRLALVYLDGSVQNRVTVQRYDAVNGWELIGEAGFSFGTATSPSLTFDQNNNPVVAYIDGSNANKLTVQRYNSNRLFWESVGLPGFSEIFLTSANILAGEGLAVASRDGNGVAQMRVFNQQGVSWQIMGNEGISDDFPAAYSSVAVDGQENAYVIFRDGQRGQKATVKKYNAASTAWEVLGNAGFSAGETTFNSLAAGNTGVFAAYNDGGSAKKLVVKKYNGATQQWDALGTPAVSKSAANYISLALDGNGGLHTVYQDAANGNRATAQKYNSATSKWEILGKEGFSDASAAYQSLAIGPDNSVWVSYTDASKGNRATVKKFNSATSAWETIGTAGFSMGATSYTNIAVDQNGSPYVAYLDASNGNRITVQRLDQNEWKVVGTVGFSEPSGGYVSLVIGGDNIPYVSFRGKDAKVEVNRYNAQLALWERVGNALLSAGAGMYTSLAYGSGRLYAAYQDAGLGNQVAVKKFITSTAGWDDLGSGRISSAARAAYAGMAVDSDENIYVAYQDVNGGNKAAVKSYRKDKKAWETLGSAAVSDGTAAFTSLTLNKDNTPYISYQDGSRFNRLTVKKFSNGAWEAVGGEGITSATVSYTGLADLNGSPLVVYADGANSGKLSSMVYDGTAWKAAGEGFSAGQAIYPSVVSNAAGSAYVAYLDNSLLRKVVVKKFDAATSSWADVGGVSATSHRADFPSIALDKAGTPYIAYQDSAFENRITVSKFNAATSKWETIGGEGFSAGAVAYTSIYVDENDKLFVLYRDGGKFNRATVKRFNAAAKAWETVAEEGISAGTVSYTTVTGKGTSLYAGYIDDGLGAVMDVKKLNENATGWDISGELGVSSGAPVAYTSVLTNSNNVPHLLFSDGGNANGAAVKEFDAAKGEWKTVGTNSISTAGVQYPVIAANSKDELFVGFSDAAQANRVHVKRYNKAETKWETFGKGTFSLQAAKHISIAVSGEDQPYVAFQDQWNTNKITVRRYNKNIGNWEIVGSEGFSNGTAEFTGIAVNKTNVPYVVYSDGGLGQKIIVKTLANSDWEPLDNEHLTAGSYSSIAIDQNDVVYVAYRDETQGGKATAKYYDSQAGDWVTLGNEGFTPAEASYTSIKIDRFNIPYVIYQDGSAGQKVSVSRYNVIKKVWEVVGTWGISAGMATYPSLAIDRNNKPYVAYTSGQAFAQAYDGVTTITAQPANISVCKDTEGKFTVTASGTDNSYQWQVDDGSGFKNLSDDGVYSGVNTATLTISAVPKSFKGYKYRVLILGAGVAMSDAASVGINEFDVALTPDPDLKATESIKYEEQLPVTGGVAPFSYSLVGGTLPAGLTLEADGKITGKPAVGSKGVYTFTVQLVESSVCKNVAVRDFTLTVDEVPADNVQVTPVVTPNGDGKNDYLAITGIEAYPDNNLYIMNRNGTKVYEMKSYDNARYPFVGRTTFGSENLPAGTYFYVFEFTDKKDGQTRRKSGYVVLKY